MSTSSQHQTAQKPGRGYTGPVLQGRDRRADAEGQLDFGFLPHEIPGAAPVSRDAPIFDRNGAFYSYVSTRDGRGAEMRFCWSRSRNAAGYFLTWTERASAAHVSRFYVRGFKRRRDARESAERSLENWRRDHERAPA